MNAVKKSIEAKFLADWNTTPIQWEGIPFTATPQWISLVFIPIDRTLYGFDGNDGRKRDTILLKITSFSDSTTRALELEDEVRTFIECYNDGVLNYKVGLGVPNGDGIISLDNGVFMTTSLYEIQNFN